MTTEIATKEDDRVAPEQRELAIRIAAQYELDLLLKHLVLIEGRAYITRDGLLHIAHRSGQFDGMTTTEPVLVEDMWRSTCSVYRKDMSHPFTYTGRYPVTGSNKKFAPEMAVKVGEVMALRRAFDVAAPTAEERWDLEAPEATTPPQRPSLAAVVAEKAAAVEPEPPPEAPSLPMDLVHDAVRVGMTEDELRKIVAHTQTSRSVVASTAKRLFPDATSSADLTDEQRETLWDVIALEADAAKTQP